MDSVNAIIANPHYQPVLGVLKGARNGLVCPSLSLSSPSWSLIADHPVTDPDGAKVRFPHALVMTLLFHQGRPSVPYPSLYSAPPLTRLPAHRWSQRINFVYSATKQHALNLCKFVSIYKTALLVQRWLAGGKERKADTFFAGLVGGGIVFGERNAVNEQVGLPFSPPWTPRLMSRARPQIVLYVVSRVITSFLPRATPSAPPAPPPTPSSSLPASRPSLPPPASAKNGFPHPPGFPYPKSNPPDSKVFSVYAALTWGAVMWLFRWRRDTLHGGMVNSMQCELSPLL